MKKSGWLLVVACLLGTVLVSGCRRSGGDMWEDTKSANRYIGKGFRQLGGKQGRDRLEACSREEFSRVGEYADDFCDFEPLQDAAAQGLINMEDLRLQPRQLPGEPGSPIPGLEAFSDPSARPELAKIFQNIYFDYDNSFIKGQANVDRVQRMADYMRSHPNTYIFVEGHCDQRGAQKYNQALGAKRANSVRKMLIEFGVDKDHVFTVSYGKDRLAVFDDCEEGYRQNRRVEFKIYET